MADRTQRALGIARRSAHQHAFDRAFQEGGEVLPQITVRPDDEQQSPDDPYDPLAAATSEPSLGLARIGRSAVDWWKAQPSWLEQAAAVRQQSDPTSPRPSPAEIEFASGMVGPATIHGIRAPVVAPAVASPFYSAAEEAVKNTPMHAASGPQWLGVLRNATGVKPEELDWTGVPEFLQGRQGAVSKQELLDHIAGNKVDVQEVMKGQDPPPGRLTVGQYEAMAREQGINWDDWQARRNFVEGLDAKRWQGSTKFGNYTLPGGANYRELLLTMPDRVEAQRQILRDEANRRGYGDQISQWPDQEFAQRYREQVTNAPSTGAFRGSHWDEPNVLAHVRFDDRNIDGDKTLHMAEIQSDWHQKGRREGYKVSDTERDRMADELQQIQAQRADPNTPREQLPELYRREGELTDAYNRGVHDAVPDAPFKTTWPELALKRMIRYAAEHGYGRISWDSGATNAERYDLSKHVKEIEYIKYPDNTYRLGIMTHNGEGVDTPQFAYKPEELPDLVGKEIADKIVSGEGKRYRGHEGTTLDNLDLKVGGEGMKGFYDKMLPTIANKLGKKYGARVEQGDLRGMQYRGYSSFVYGEGPLGHPAVYGVKPNGEMQLVRQNFADQLAARNEVEKLNSGGDLNTVHTLKITPELRKAALQQGFPMFAKGGKVTAGQMARRHAHQQAFDQAFPRR